MFKIGDKVRFIGPASNKAMDGEFPIGSIHTVKTVRYDKTINVNDSFRYAPYDYKFKLVVDKPYNKDDWM